MAGRTSASLCSCLCGLPSGSPSSTTVLWVKADRLPSAERAARMSRDSGQVTKHRERLPSLPPPWVVRLVPQRCVCSLSGSGWMCYIREVV